MVPRAEGTDWEIFAPAKLNLFLEVLGKRSDGFHDLETLMLPVSFGDQVRWTPTDTNFDLPSVTGDGCTFFFDCHPLGGDARRVEAELCRVENLIVRAARLVAERGQVEPRGQFVLTKRIPLQAGMGGGSSDAAATLFLANRVWQAGLSITELNELAAQLGSDVPFFLHRGPAICRGRGERVERLEQLPRLSFVIVKPDRGLSTREIFDRLEEGRFQENRLQEHGARGLADVSRLFMPSPRRQGSIFSLREIRRVLFNRFEEVVNALMPIVCHIKSKLVDAGCLGTLMTGSGSAVFGIARSPGHARRVAHRLAAMKLGTVVAASNL